jgi:trigger factor
MSADQQTDAADTPTTQEKAEVDAKNELLVEFTVSASWQDVNEEINKVALKYSADVKLAGFRKGKVPLDIVRSHYKEALTDEAVNNVINKQVVDKIQSDKIKVLSNPSIKNMEFEEGKDLKADIIVEVFPEINLPELEKLAIKVDKKEIQSEAYDEKKQIEAILEANKKRIPLKGRSLQEGDWTILQVQSRLMDSKRLTPKKEVPLLIDSNQEHDIQKLANSLIGRDVGDEITIKNNYPAEYKKKVWAGKEVEHYVKIQKGFEMVTPEFNQDFIKSIGYENEEVLKKKLKEDYEKFQVDVKEDKKLKLLVEKLNETVEFPVPRTLVEQEMIRLNSREGQMVQITNDQQKDEYLTNLKQKAEKSVKFSLIMDAVEQKYEIKVGSEELQQEMKKIAEANKVDLVKVRQYYSNPEKKKELEDSMTRIKVMDFLKEKITFREV